MTMKNWARCGSFRRCPSMMAIGPIGIQMWLAGNTFTSIAPGGGGQLRYDMTAPGPGDFEGNPDAFARLTWLVAPTSGEAHYAPTFRYTAFEDASIRSARALQNKQVTLSMQFRCPNVSTTTVGCQVAMILWRGNCNIPVQQRFPWPDISMQLWSSPVYNIMGGPTVQRFDWTMTLPLIYGFIPDGSSYLGIGFDMIGPSGPVLDLGPYQLNEGGPQPIAETPYWDEVVAQSA